MATKSPQASSTMPLIIGTHNGHFHADEALAVYLLRLLPLYSNARLIRTRDPSVLATCHTVVDVGGVYDANVHRFDHHQRGFGATFPGKGTLLSAAGLVYLHHGREILAGRLERGEQMAIVKESADAGAGVEAGASSEENAVVEELWQKLYSSFVEAVDADDNGISVWETSANGAETRTKRFEDGGVRLSALVADLNLDWHDERVSPGMLGPSPDVTGEQEAEDARFETASQLMGTVFLRKLAHLTGKWLPARRVVAKAFGARMDVDRSGRLMELAEPVVWKDHLYESEMKAGGPKVLYVLYPETKKADAKWRVQAVSLSKDSFESRRPLRAEWRGLRDEELSRVSGIEGCVFVHAAGFIGGNTSKEGAVEMARKSLI